MWRIAMLKVIFEGCTKEVKGNTTVFNYFQPSDVINSIDSILIHEAR